MNTRLIVVEGLPCSGKSSMARFVADTLQSAGCTVHHVDEGTLNHPADYEFHAFRDGEIIPLAELPDGARQALMPSKIYDGLPWETEAPLMLDKWRSFVQAVPADAVHVFNCVLLQNPMCETMMRFNLPEAESARHIAAIAEIIAPLQPLVIYLHNDDIAASVQHAAGERPGWLDAVIPYHTRGAYGRAVRAEGFDGFIACLAARQTREERILRALPLRSVILDNPQRNWPGAKRHIAALLGL